MEKKELLELVNALSKESHIRDVIDSEIYYFEKLEVLYQTYKTFNIAPFKHKMDEFITSKQKGFKFQDLLTDNEGTDFYDFLVLIGKLTALFDAKGYNINTWNPYSDKRVISTANFTQNNWTWCLFMYKSNRFNFDNISEKTYATFINTIKFVENPSQYPSISSQGHIRQIYTYFKLNDQSEIITLFPEISKAIKNTQNIGVLISLILYHNRVKELWLDGVIGLMASDGTGWHDDYIEKFQNFNLGAIWYDKSPSGTDRTIKFLREIIDEGQTKIGKTSIVKF
jgi:5-methylcytosine-specific restriction enzyme B